MEKGYRMERSMVMDGTFTLARPRRKIVNKSSDKRRWKKRDSDHFEDEDGFAFVVS